MVATSTTRSAAARRRANLSSAGCAAQGDSIISYLASQEYFASPQPENRLSWRGTAGMLVCAADIRRKAGPGQAIHLESGCDKRAATDAGRLARRPKVAQLLGLALMLAHARAGGSLAAGVQPLPAMTERVLDQYVLPRFDKLKQATDKLAADVAKLCSGEKRRLQRGAGRLRAGGARLGRGRIPALRSHVGDGAAGAHRLLARSARRRAAAARRRDRAPRRHRARAREPRQEERGRCRG